MSYRNKTYVCLDFDEDKNYYFMMKARKEHDKIDFDFHNAHDLNNIWSESQEDSIKRKLRERLENTKVMIVLIGEKTKFKHKFVRREMEIALTKNIPIIGVNLNGTRSIDDTRVPSIIKEQLIIYVSFNAKIIKFALDNRVTWFYEHQKNGKKGAFYYDNTIYTDLGL